MLDGLQRLFRRRALQSNQSMWRSLTIFYHFTLDLIGTELNSSSSRGMGEDPLVGEEPSICRLKCYKEKYVAYVKGDLELAAEMYEKASQYPRDLGGELVL